MEQPPEPKRRRSQRLRQAAAGEAGGSRGAPQQAPGLGAAKAAAPPTPDGAWAAAAAADDGRSSTGSPFAHILLPELLQRIAGFMERNEVACRLRLVGKTFAEALPGPRYTNVRLSEPSPPAAFAWKWSRPDALHSLNRKQREQLELLTARSGSIANLQTLAARGDLPRLSCSTSEWAELLEAAAGAGRLELCSWLRQQGAPATLLVTRAAAENGELAAVQFLVDTSSPADVLYAAYAAARHGHVHVLDWLLGRMQPDAIDASVFAGMAHGCTLDVLQRLHARYFAGRQLHPRQLEDWLAAAGGSPTPDWQEKVEWLEALGCPRSSTACAEAALQPDALARLQWLLGRCYALDRHVAYAAAEAGNAEALLYLQTEGVEVNAWTAFIAARRAARHGQLSILQVLHAEVGVDGSCGVVEAAAACGHLPVVAWAAEQLGGGFELTVGLFRAAARSGSWPLLRWLHERGCPRDASVLAAAVCACHGEQLEWLHDHGCPWDASVFVAAAGACSEEQLEWLVERGCPMGDDDAAYVTAVRAHDMLILRCLHRLGCPFASDGGTFTAAVGHMSCYGDLTLHEAALHWLLDEGCPVDWPAAMEAASRSVAMKSWLQEQRRQRQGRVWEGRLRSTGRSAT